MTTVKFQVEIEINHNYHFTHRMSKEHILFAPNQFSFKIYEASPLLIRILKKNPNQPIN